MTSEEETPPENEENTLKMIDRANDSIVTIKGRSDKISQMKLQIHCKQKPAPNKNEELIKKLDSLKCLFSFCGDISVLEVTRCRFVGFKCVSSTHFSTAGTTD